MMAKRQDYKDDLKKSFFPAFLKSEKFLLSITTPKLFELESCATCQIIENIKSFTNPTYFLKIGRGKPEI